MRLRILITAVCLSTTCIFIEAHSQPSDLHRKIDNYVNPYVQTKNFNGTILVAKAGEKLYEKSFGFANEDFKIVNTESTVYHIASVSKNFTAAAILLLEQNGKLKLTDRVDKYINNLKRGPDISIHQLLTHTSGIPNVNNMPEYVTASRFPQTLTSLIDIFKDKPLDFEPGSKYSYSNSNYNLLAFIIEKVSGKTYGEFLREELFIPAGMQQTAHHENANAIIENCAVGYQTDGNFGLEKSEYLDWSSKTGNGSMYTSASDLLRWDRVLAEERILRSSALEKMYTNHVSNAGYGCFVKEHLGRKRSYMNGRSPGFTSYFARYPDDDVCIIVLANNYIPVATSMGMDIAAIYFGEKYEGPQLSASIVSNVLSKRLTGTYQFGADFYRPNFVMTVSEKNGRLSIDWGELIPSGGMNFIARAFWSDVSFEQDEKGNIQYLIYDGYKGKKIN